MKRCILRTATALLAVIMLLITSASAMTIKSVPYGGNSDNLLTFEGTLNQEMMNAIPESERRSSAIQYADNSSDFSLKLYANSDDTFTGEGHAKLDNGIVYYSATGKIIEYVLDNGDHAFIGTISEDTTETRTLSLTVHSIPAKNKTFVYVNEAIRDQNGVIVDNKPYIFGELFDEMNQFVPLYSEELNSTTEQTDEGNEGMPEPYVTTNDYNSKFIQTVISIYPQNGTYYQLIALSAFGPSAMTPFGTHYFYAKVNSNYGQARAYANYLSPGVVIGTSVTGGQYQ